LEPALGLDEVDTPAALTRSELGTPGRGVEGRSEVDVVHHPALLEVRLAAGPQHFADSAIRLRAVQVDTGSVHLEGHWLLRHAHASTVAVALGGQAEVGNAPPTRQGVEPPRSRHDLRPPRRCRVSLQVRTLQKNAARLRRLAG